MTKTEQNKMKQIRVALCDAAGNEEWLTADLDGVYSWFGGCDTVEEAVQLMCEQSIEPHHC